MIAVKFHKLLQRCVAVYSKTNFLFFKIMELLFLSFLFWLIFSTALLFPSFNTLNIIAAAQNFNLFSLGFVLFISLLYAKTIKEISDSSWKAKMFLTCVIFSPLLLNIFLFVFTNVNFRFFLPTLVAFGFFMIFSYKNPTVLKFGGFFWVLRLLIYLNLPLFLPEVTTYTLGWEPSSSLLLYREFVLGFSLFLLLFYGYYLLGGSLFWSSLTSKVAFSVLIIGGVVLEEPDLVDAKKIYPGGYEFWKQGVSKIYKPGTSDSAALRVFKDYGFGGLYRSYGGDGFAVKNEIFLINTIAANLPSDRQLVLSSTVSSTENFYLVTKCVFDETSIVEKSNHFMSTELKPFVCRIIGFGNVERWAAVSYFNARVEVSYIQNPEVIKLLNYMQYESEGFKESGRQLFSDPALRFPVFQHSLGDLLILDRTSGLVSDIIELKNLRREDSIRDYRQNKNIALYAHYYSRENRLMESFSRRTNEYFNRELNDPYATAISRKAYDQLLSHTHFHNNIRRSSILHNTVTTNILQYLIKK